MKTEANILIVGGSAGGFLTALTAKASHLEKTVMLIRKDQHSVIPAAIPYILGSNTPLEQGVFPDSELEELGIEIRIGVVVQIMPEEHICVFDNRDEVHYESLILATGSVPNTEKRINIVGTKHVYQIEKNMHNMDALRIELTAADNVGIIGGGLTGIELANQFSRMGKQVCIVEKNACLAQRYFDETICQEIREELEKIGITCKCNSQVKEIREKNGISEVCFENGESISADFWILANGYEPNDTLATGCGIKTDPAGGILTDRYGRTNLTDIYAIGDCVAKKDMQSSAAAVESILTALFLGKQEKSGKEQTIGSYMIRINDCVFGAVGITETKAKEEGIDVIVGKAEGPDRHPFFVFPETQSQMVILIADKKDGRIVGGEIKGGPSAAELIIVITVIVQNRMRVEEVMALQLAGHPQLTPSPGCCPIRSSARNIWLSGQNI